LYAIKISFHILILSLLDALRSLLYRGPHTASISRVSSSVQSDAFNLVFFLPSELVLLTRLELADEVSGPGDGVRDTRELLLLCGGLSLG